MGAGAMGMAFKIVVAFCIGLGALYAAQRMWLSAVTAQIGDQPHSPSAPLITIDPETMRKAQEVGRSFDTGPVHQAATEAAHRAAVAGAEAQIREMNRNAARWAVPVTPPSIPGM